VTTSFRFLPKHKNAAIGCHPAALAFSFNRLGCVIRHSEFKVSVWQHGLAQHVLLALI